MGELTSDEQLRRALSETKVIAVLGAHEDEGRPSFGVPRYLAEHGYRIIPVNPKFAGRTMWGETAVASLTDISERVDMVDVFRPSSALDSHLPEFLGMAEKPAVVWFQLGIRNDDVAGRLTEEGIDVVQDRCAKVEHMRLKVGDG